MAATIVIKVISDSGGLDKVKGEIASIGQAAASQGGGFSGLQEIATGAFRAIGGAAVELAGKGIQALGGFLQDSIGKAGDFQAQMLEFQAVAGKGVDTAGLQQFHDLFIQLGKDLPVSTSDVQKAAIELVKGGIDPATISAGGLKSAIQFAAAAMGGDLAGAAETSAKVVGGWADVTATAEEKAQLLTHATDLLTKAANASTVDVHDLALGLYNVQGTAKAAGLSLDETTTALAELAPRFSNANTAGTALRNFLVRLQPTTKPATDAMNELGLMTTSTTKIMQFLQAQGIKPLGTDLDTLGNQFTEFAAAQGFTAKETDKIWQSFAQSKFFDDATGKFVGTAKASQILQEATKGLTDAQRLQYLQTIFGNDAMNAAAAFAEMGAQGYTNMAGALANANGVQENAAIKQKSFNTALENFKGSIEALQITIGEKFLPVLTDLFNNTLAPAVNTVTTLATAIFGDQAAFDSLSPSLQGVVVFFQQLGATVLQAIGWFQQVAAAFQQGGAAADNLSTVAQNAFNAILASGQTIFGTLQQYIPAVMAVIQEVVGAVLTQVAAFWQAHGEEIMAFVAQTWATITDIYNTYLKLVLEIVIGVLKMIADFINQHGTEIQTILSGAWQAISGIIRAALALIQGTLHAALDIMHGDWQKAWQDIQDMSATFVSAIASAIMGFLNMIAGFFGTSLQGIVDTWTNNWNMMVSIISRFVADGAAAIAPVVSWFNDISGAIQGAIGWVQSLADKLASIKIPDWLQGHSPPPMADWFTYIGQAAQFAGAGIQYSGAALAYAGTAPGASTSITRNSALTLNYTANNYGQRSAQQDYSVMSALARGFVS